METSTRAKLPEFYRAQTAPTTLLIVGDCRQVMRRTSLADGPDKFDLIFADPPFGWDVKYENWDDGMPRSEYLKFTYEWLDAGADLLRPGGSFWVHIPDDTAAEIVMHMKAKGFQLRNWCIWSYRFGQWRDGNFIVGKCHDLWFVKPGGKVTFNGDAVLVPSDRRAVYGDKRTEGKKGGNDGMRVPLDVWGSEGDGGEGWGRVSGNNRERRSLHPNQLPEPLLERIIKACSNPGDLVLDPFCGSGGTATVARALGRKCVTIEISSEYAASAWERITVKGPVRVVKA